MSRLGLVAAMAGLGAGLRDVPRARSTRRPRKAPLPRSAPVRSGVGGRTEAVRKLARRKAREGRA